MKKYYRLILVIVSVASLVSLLFYRHEYNRLRYVLEVLNFFGKPGDIVVPNDCFANNSLFMAENVTFADSHPVWRRLSNDLFFYSAFWEDHGKKEHVKAIGAGRNPSSLKVGCRLWYENQEFSSEGRVSFDTIPMKLKQSSLDKEKVHPYFVTCTPEVTLGNVPYSVNFYLEGFQGYEVNLPVTTPDLSQDITNSTVICVTPSGRRIPPLETAEFIGFHQILGVAQYIVYDDGLLTPAALLLLKERHLGYRVTMITWNFPFMALEASAMALRWDCLFRSASIRPAGVIQLAWHQLAVPRYHHSITSLIHDFDTHQATARFLLPNVKFCSEYPEHKSTVNLKSLRRLYYAETKPLQDTEWAVERPYLVLQGSRTQQRISRGIMAIHSYESCKDATSVQAAPPRKYDNAMSKFATELHESKLVKLWFERQNF